jgi:exopolysaccharide biosynthesis protein
VRPLTLLLLLLALHGAGVCQVYAFKVPAEAIKAKVKPIMLKPLTHQYLLVVNGTFFDPPTQTVLGFIVSDGKILQKGVFTDAIIVKGGKAMLVTLRKPDDLKVDFCISAGPVLVRDGKVAVGRERSKVGLSLRERARRTGIGILNPQTLIIIVSVTPITLREFAWLFLKYKATDALNLDGGNSVYLAYKGKTYAWRRNPLNVIMATDATPLKR